MIVTRDVTITAGRRELLTGVNLRVAPGEIVGLVGASGSGKTTLGRVVVGLAGPAAGTVEVDGAPLPARPDGSMAILFQSPRRSFDPRMRLRRAVSACAREELDATAWDALCARCDLHPGLLDRLPREVSDGQLQRASLARALASRPRYLFCDEPTSALDPAAAAAVITALRAVADGGTGILFSSHDLPLLAACSDRILQIRDNLLVPYPAPRMSRAHGANESTN